MIIVFEVCKIYLRNYHQEAAYYYFFFNLLSCYQALVLAFCIITLILEMFFLKRLPRKRGIFASTIIFLFLIICCEALSTYLLYNPVKIPGRFFGVFRSYYENYDCKLIQFESQATEFDKHLFYKLRESERFRYKNKEFSNVFHTNSKSFRDVENALTRPSIVCLGDSYTLGWGVEQADTYSEVIKNITGLNTLNTGMSSYGTARESMVLAGLDTSNVKFLIWQYCSNDDDENIAFVNNNFRSVESSKIYFDKSVHMQKWTTAYFPGKHFLTIFKMLFSLRKKPVPITPNKTAVDQRQRAVNFLDIVAKSKIDFTRTKLIVVELSPQKWSSVFLSEVTKVANESQFAEEFSGNIMFVDLNKILKKEDYYLLDLHLTKEGNAKVGTYLAKIIKQLQGD